ncbi:MAG: hypothetical protein PWQ58_1133 [Archaeoglobaceae archaeon]|nr:hypothetical protein [Archaeoglobaceae archaeon]
MKVAVIGGGISGLGVAYFLAKLGAEVEVFEQKYLLYGASGRNSGGITAQFMDKELIEMALRTMKLYEKLQSEIKFNFLLRKGGYLKLSDNPRELEKEVEYQKSAGLKVKFLSPEDVKEIFPDINTNAFKAASYFKDGAVIFPWPVIWGLAKGCRELGVKIYDWTPAEVVSETEVKVKNEVKKYDVIVNAAGAWSAEINNKLGIKNDLRVVKEEICVTESLRPYIDPYIIHSNGLYLSQSMRGEIVGGIVGKAGEKSLDSSLDFLVKYAKLATKLVPKLRGLSILRQWSGVYDETKNGKPNFGFTGKVFQLNGFGKNGMSLALAYAEKASKEIMKS